MDTQTQIGMKTEMIVTPHRVFLMANGAISWASQQQKMVALSVGEAEYMELASTGRQAAWLNPSAEK